MIMNHRKTGGLKMSVFKNSDGKSVLLAMVKGIQDHKAYLGEVDGLIGRRPWMNMNKGFSLFEKRFAIKNSLLQKDCLS